MTLNDQKDDKLDNIFHRVIKRWACIFLVNVFIVIIFFIVDARRNDTIPSEFNQHEKQTTIKSINHNKKITRILVVGYGRSGTTFMQQFIGNVIFNGYKEVFYLFEPTHGAQDKMFVTYYGNKTNVYPNIDLSNINNIRSLAQTDFFHCNFDVFRMNHALFYHQYRNKKLNKFTDSNITTIDEMEHDCASKKIRIYKDIHFKNFAISYQYLLANLSYSLKIIEMVRNPMTHILSNAGLRSAPFGKMERFKTTLFDICINQLSDIKYAVTNWKKKPTFTLIKTEQFFLNISESFNATIFYFYSLLMDHQIDLKQLNMTIFSNKYKSMFLNQLQVGKPFQHHGILNEKQFQLIKGNCTDIAMFMNYTLA